MRKRVYAPRVDPRKMPRQTADTPGFPESLARFRSTEPTYPSMHEDLEVIFNADISADERKQVRALFESLVTEKDYERAGELLKHKPDHALWKSFEKTAFNHGRPGDIDTGKWVFIKAVLDKDVEFFRMACQFKPIDTDLKFNFIFPPDKDDTYAAAPYFVWITSHPQRAAFVASCASISSPEHQFVRTEFCEALRKLLEPNEFVHDPMTTYSRMVEYMIKFYTINLRLTAMDFLRDISLGEMSDMEITLAATRAVITTPTSFQ